MTKATPTRCLRGEVRLATDPAVSNARSIARSSHSQNARSAAEVRFVQPVALNHDDAENVTPLTVRHFITEAVPTELLQKYVLRRVHVKELLGIRCDPQAHPPRHLFFIERRASQNEQIDFGRCPAMDQVCARLGADSLPQGLRIGVEFISQEREERLHVIELQGYHEIHVKSRTRLPAHRACQRTADKIPDAALLQSIRHLQRYLERLRNHVRSRSTSRRPGMRVPTRAFRSLSTARRSRHSPSDARGYLIRTPANANSCAVRVNDVTVRTLSSAVIRRHRSTCTRSAAGDESAVSTPCSPSSPTGRVIMPPHYHAG